MNIEKIRELNPHIKIYSVADPEFSEYGKLIYGIDISDIAAAADSIPMPKEGSVYHASEPTFETLSIAGEIRDKVFGTLPSQLGYCFGFSNTLNATEWHSCSELNIALTPLVLILGKRNDIKDGKLDSGDMKAFYLPYGTVVEVYATTLHFCPCQVEAGGFKCVVGLTQGTNTDLVSPTSDALLFRKNKWIMAHVDNKALIARGVVPGITGENYTINF